MNARHGWGALLALGLSLSGLPGQAADAGAPPAPAVLSAAATTALLDQLEAALREVETVQARFTQEKHLALFADVVTAKGVIVFRRPQALRFELCEPFQSVVVVSDGRIGRYEKTAAGWRRLKAAENDALLAIMNQLAFWMRGQFRAEARAFAITAEQQPAGEVVVLTPQAEQFRKLISRIELVVRPDRSGIRAVVIREPDADYTVLSFATEVRNQPVADELLDPARETPAPLPAAPPPPAGAAP